MSLRFQHIYFSLMALSFLCAFVLPARVSDLGHVKLEAIFIPISRPAYHLSNWVRGRVDPAQTTSASSAADDDLRQQNAQLEQEVLTLQAQVARLQSLAGERQTLGPLQSLCDRFDVASADPAPREGLMLDGNLNGVAEKQLAIFNGGLAGSIDRVGPGFAHVRLATDPSFTVAGFFVRLTKTANGIEPQRVGDDLMPIVHGAGEGRMVIVNLYSEDVTRAGVQPGDWVVLDDDAFPAAAKKLRIGQVASVGKWIKNPLFADIRLQNEPGLVRLSNVYVMVRER